MKGIAGSLEILVVDEALADALQLNANINNLRRSEQEHRTLLEAMIVTQTDAGRVAVALARDRGS
jgi:plasmid stability protein|tara:strand:- start:413 stop:607 length:195 start_codon:yes stop_codon:yes gene_type:complete